MYYVYDKRADALMKMVAKPSLTRGGQFELLTEDQFLDRLAEKDRGLFVTDDDLSAGVATNEDGR
jgi:hypothetical protein